MYKNCLSLSAVNSCVITVMLCYVNAGHIEW